MLKVVEELLKTQLRSSGYRKQVVGLSSSLKVDDMSDDIPSSNDPTLLQQATCAGCRRVITDRYLLKIVRRRTANNDAFDRSADGDTTSDMIWHEGCLKCSCCSCILIRVSASLYVRGDLVLCRQDYLRWSFRVIFGQGLTLSMGTIQHCLGSGLNIN